MKNEIVLYHHNKLAEHSEVRFDNDTAWLTQAQIVVLFGTKSQAITKHINNIYSTEELDKTSTCSIPEQVRHEGNRSVKRKLAHYNLDMIISIGYSVNSINATLFHRMRYRSDAAVDLIKSLRKCKNFREIGRAHV